jgi:hypothetical protein
MTQSKPQTPQRFNADEPIAQTGATLGDFWAWAFSDVLSNGTRAAFAEFMVGTALGCLDDMTRLDWDQVDLRYGQASIEVKASGYVQSWQQQRKSAVKFDIEPKTGWNAVTNEYDPTIKRRADCYVFCLFEFDDIHDKAGATQQVMNVDSWRFCVISTATIDCVFGSQKSVSLGRLKSAGFAWIPYAELRQAVDAALG